MYKSSVEGMYVNSGDSTNSYASSIIDKSSGGNNDIFILIIVTIEICMFIIIVRFCLYLTRQKRLIKKLNNINSNDASININNKAKFNKFISLVGIPIGSTSVSNANGQNSCPVDFDIDCQYSIKFVADIIIFVICYYYLLVTHTITSIILVQARTNHE